jgi:hypothetical protein
MRCLSCDCELTDIEATKKYENGNDYIDLCDRCLDTIVDDLDSDDETEVEDDDDSDTRGNVRTSDDY